MSTAPIETEVTYATPTLRRENWSAAIGLAVFFAVLCWTLWTFSGGHVQAFHDVAGIVLMCGLTIGLLLASCGWRGICNAFRVLTRGDERSERCRDAAGTFRLAATFTLISGYVGTLIGLVSMLMNMADPSQIGAGMAVALLTMLYGALAAALLFVAATVIARREPTCETFDTTTRWALPTTGAVTAFGVMGCLLAFFLVLLSMGAF